MLDDCSLIEVTGETNSEATVEINHCQFESISLHKATDYNPVCSFYLFIILFSFSFLY
jgi:hypothetical protein